MIEEEEDFSGNIAGMDEPKFKSSPSDPATKTIRASMHEIRTTEDVEAAVLSGAVRLLLPVDARVSPWPVAKMFELSLAQAEVYISALRSMPAEERMRIEYVLRRDGTVAVRRTHAQADLDRLPDGGADQVQGSGTAEYGGDDDTDLLHAAGHA